MPGKTLRIFPRRTNATPDDGDVRVGTGPGLYDEADAVKISVAFTWDLPEAERLERAWRSVAPVTVGGPATGEPGGEFTPGLFLKRGYTITSRGCPNRCWFCSVWRREGKTRELAIKPGWNVLDDNLLACGERHVLDVIAMAGREARTAGRGAIFSGGLEAARMTPAYAAALRAIHPDQVFLAYDNPAKGDALVEAVRMLYSAGFPKARHGVRAFVLMGYPGDTIAKAEGRIRFALEAGAFPAAMLYRGDDGRRDPIWAKFQSTFFRPARTAAWLQNQERRWEARPCAE